MEIDYFEKYKVELRALQECHMTYAEALQILTIAIEYGKPNRGKWQGNS